MFHQKRLKHSTVQQTKGPIAVLQVRRQVALVLEAVVLEAVVLEAVALAAVVLAAAAGTSYLDRGARVLQRLSTNSPDDPEIRSVNIDH